MGLGGSGSGSGSGGGVGSGGVVGSGGGIGGGIGSGSGGVTVGTGGAASGGAQGTGGVTGCGALIDDFESNTGYICRDNGRVGYWFLYTGSGSTLFPASIPVPPSLLTPPRGSSQRALHAYGTSVLYGAGVACFINNPPAATYNASGYTGIRFYVKGTAGGLKFIVQTRATESQTYGGMCTLPTFSCAANEAFVSGVLPDDWTLYSVPFSALMAGTAPFDVTDIWSVEFQPGPGGFDFWIDDLSFY